MQPQLNQKIESWPASKVRPYHRNARFNEKTVAAIVASVKEFGFQGAILVDPDGLIITGHARWKALTELGYDQIPVIVSDMPQALAQKFRIADNAIHEQTQWDMTNLLAELREIGGAEQMQHYFPEVVNLKALLAESTGQNVAPVAAQSVVSAAAQAANRFNAGPSKALVELTCPHCLKTFEVEPEPLVQEAALNAQRQAQTPAA